MTITVILGMVVVMAYNNSMQAYIHTERKLQALASFRNTADRLEREVNSVVFKSGVWERPMVVYDGGPGCYRNVWWETMVKYIHADPTSPNPGTSRLETSPININWSTAPDSRSIYQINFRPRYMGYYSTLDGFTIDRTELYYNPPEDRQVWDNGEDDDGDDPDGAAGLRTLYDDKGCLMFRKKFDRDMCWAEWYDPAVKLAPRLGPSNVNRYRPNDYRDPYHGPYSRSNFPPSADEQAGPLNVEQLVTSGDLPGPASLYDMPRSTAATQTLKDKGFVVDTGTVIGEGFSDLRFSYLYKLPDTDHFIYADWWPWDNDSNPNNANALEAHMPVHTVQVIQGGTVHQPNWQGWCALCNQSVPYTHGVTNAPIVTNFDIAYFTLPVAISVKFTFTVQRQEHVYEKLIYLHASRWLMYLNP
jgi:hypothetical protein